MDLDVKSFSFVILVLKVQRQKYVSFF